MRTKFHQGVIVALLAALAAGIPWAVAQGHTNKPSVKVFGSCHSSIDGGSLKIVASGFVPKAVFLFKLRRPDGKVEFPPAMWVDKFGNATVSFKCSLGPDGINPEPAGKYKVSFLEYSATGAKAEGQFEVSK